MDNWVESEMRQQAVYKKRNKMTNIARGEIKRIGDEKEKGI